VALHLIQPQPQPQPARPKLIIEGVSKRFFSKRASRSNSESAVEILSCGISQEASRAPHVR
jgi:hypothetical protein